MKFALKRKEIMLVSVLALLVYAFVFYKFIWIPVVPDISAQKEEISRLNSEKEKLDSNLKDLEANKAKIVSIKSGSERLDGYLNNEANVMDCIEYMDKLAKIAGADITNINIATPEKKEADKSTYYEIKIDFTTMQDIQGIRDLVDFIENSSKIINISRLEIKPDKEKAKASTTVKAPVVTQTVNKPATATGTPANPGNTNAVDGDAQKEIYTANLTISMYAINLESADKFYEYGRHKFNRYQYGDISPLELTALDVLSGKSNNITVGTNTSSESNTTDFEINLNSFLSAGDNLTVFGTDKLKDKYSSKTNKYITMSVNINKSSYTVAISDGGGISSSFSGSVPDRDLNMLINTNLSLIPENKGLGLKIKLVNNSGNKLNIVKKDVTKKVTLTDRNAREIKDGNNQEKALIK